MRFHAYADRHRNHSDRGFPAMTNAEFVGDGWNDGNSTPVEPRDPIVSFEPRLLARFVYTDIGLLGEGGFTLRNPPLSGRPEARHTGSGAVSPAASRSSAFLRQFASFRTTPGFR